jgi:hypothetical protein
MILALSAVSAVFMALAGPARGVGMTLGLLGFVILPWALPATQRMKVRVTLGMAVGAPLLLEFCLVAMWLAAWGILGQIPREHLNDPKSIHPLVDLLSGFAWLLVLGLPVSFLGAIWLSCLAWPMGRGKPARRMLRLLRSVFAGVAGWSASFVLSRWIDGFLPVNVGSWFMD